jgi:hypothetical protein
MIATISVMEIFVTRVILLLARGIVMITFTLWEPWLDFLQRRRGIEVQATSQ